MDAYKSHVKDLPLVEAQTRYFTLAHANRALVLVRRIISDVLKNYQIVMDQQEIMEFHQTHGASEQARQSQQNILCIIERLQNLADELTILGVEMKDWAIGIVDFPAVADGREVRLCWRHDEQAVGFWHEIDDDCAVRRNIDTLAGTLP
ncbi:MAG: DUF2203 domain-containing protein [Planctomycetes bacterium]|nr:DUF2203 domain-containing protein [Planctomycetota bacterium]